jgi:hypothetical protein
MTLGCGGYGGNITSDNISPRHLLNIKRLAYEVTAAPSAQTGATPQTARATASSGVSAETLARRVNAFLGQRGFSPSSSPSPPVAVEAEATQAPLDFVCEDDVRVAIRAGRKLVISERAIVTPAARELAEAHRVLTIAPWRA